MERRRFLGSALAGAGSLVLGCTGDSRPPPAGAPATPTALAEGAPLPLSPMLANESEDPALFQATLRAAPVQRELLAGRTTTLLAYNETSPGPLLELREGQRVRIAFDNALAEDSTIHWHGLPVPADQDGNPMDPVPAGTRRVYEFGVRAGTAGTYWYHPHPHDRTAAQVVDGLAGPLIVRAADDPLAQLPETTLFITSLRLDAGAQVAPDDAVDWTVGRQHDTLLVNGARMPVLGVRPGTTQRLRIVNATPARHFRLALDGHVLTLVGSDGGLLGVPIGGLSEVLLAPAQRIEVVVAVSSEPGARFALRALPFEADFLGLGSYTADTLLTLATTAEPALAPLPVPAVLRPIRDLGDTTIRQAVTLGEVHDLCTSKGASVAFLINGRRFDPARVDLVTDVGRVELWDVVNDTAMAHPFHVHGTQFQLVSRQTGTVVTPAAYLAWIDTVLVPSQQTATIKLRQSLPGKRMFHCHILEHEDNCMMAILDVRPSAAPNVSA
ncbi:MAG: multicopper oxidase family protein [Candidatus Levyibacteriota bacterium]